MLLLKNQGKSQFPPNVAVYDYDIEMELAYDFFGQYLKTEEDFKILENIDFAYLNMHAFRCMQGGGVLKQDHIFLQVTLFSTNH